MAKYEKSSFKPAEYEKYCGGENRHAYVVHDVNGWVFRVHKQGVHGWFAFPAHGLRLHDSRWFDGKTLTECASKVKVCGSFKP